MREQIKMEVTCPKCNGRKEIDIRCWSCGGAGEEWNGEKLCQCEECYGDGVLEDQTCDNCGGDGFIDID